MSGRNPLRAVTLQRQTAPAPSPDPVLVRILADMVEQAMKRERQAQ